MMTGMDEVPDEDISKAFCAFDVSNTGYIRAEDLVRMMASVGEIVTVGEARDMVCNCHAPHDLDVGTHTSARARARKEFRHHAAGTYFCSLRLLPFSLRGARVNRYARRTAIPTARSHSKSSDELSTTAQCVSLHKVQDRRRSLPEKPTSLLPPTPTMGPLPLPSLTWATI